MAQPYIGQIIAVGFNYTPVNWLACDGTLYNISDYDALYVLIGTTYGGNGTSNFAVPDLRGRAALGMGQGSRLSNYLLGQRSGAEAVTLIANQIGAHAHALHASAQDATSTTPGTSLVLAKGTEQNINVYGDAAATTALSPAAITASPGGGQPHENRQPSLAIQYIICASGLFPQQS